ncbi:uncharacterized protein [Heterodontus francisci]|uniref:uncharacterized protein n=1 Tax=Heterodontus francisci TaxID=7792 RepID=UPI00355C4733
MLNTLRPPDMFPIDVYTFTYSEAVRISTSKFRVIFCLTAAHLKMLISRGLMLIVFIFLKYSTSTTPSSESTTQPVMNLSGIYALAIVIPLLLVLGIAGLLIWCYVHNGSKGFHFPRLQKWLRESATEEDATQSDVQQRYIYKPRPNNSSSEQLSSSNASPTYQVNHTLPLTQHNYENVMIGPISQTEEVVTNSAFISPAVLQQFQASQSMDYDEGIYENNPSVHDSAVYYNYTGRPKDENDDTYIIPSE